MPKDARRSEEDVRLDLGGGGGGSVFLCVSFSAFLGFISFVRFFFGFECCCCCFLRRGEGRKENEGWDIRSRWDFYWVLRRKGVRRGEVI